MFRILSFCFLLASLIGIAVMTLDYVDPPISDPLVFGFVKSDKYLPAGDSISREDLYSPISKLLADDRRAYLGILCLSGVALVSTVALFISSSRRRNVSEQDTAV
jgi:hypothetical protein